MRQLHACTVCGKPGHNRRTCDRGAAPKRAGIPDPRIHEMAPAEAERILARLRPLVAECSREPVALDSLLLSAYLRGMLDGDLAREARGGEAVAR